MMTKNPKTICMLALGALISLSIGGFIYYRSQALIQGPTITLQHPQTDAIVDDPLLAVTGNAQYTAELLLNGNAVYMTATGDFDETIVLPPGYSTLSMIATDKFGKKTEKTIDVYLQQQPDDIATIENQQPKTDEPITNNL